MRWRRLLAATLLAGIVVIPALARSDAGAQVTIPTTLPTLPTTTTTTEPEPTTTTTEPDGESTTTTTEPDGESTTTTTEPEGESTTTTTEPPGAPEGALSISAPAAVLLAPDTPVGPVTISGALGTVTVQDDRGAVGAAWTATVTTSHFVTGGGTAAETIDRANVAYWSGPAVATAGIGVFTPGQLTALEASALDVPRTAFSMASGIGDNSVSWSPTLVVTVPASAVAGTYTGTVTHSVA